MSEDELRARVGRSGAARVAATGLAALTAAAAIDGCSAPSRGEPTAETHEAVSACTDPFTTSQCKAISSSSSGSSSGGIRPKDARLNPAGYSEYCWCGRVTGTPDGGNREYVWQTSGTPAPDPLVGCTAGLSFQDPGWGSGTVWACPSWTPLPTRLTDGSIPLCIFEGYGGYVSPDGSPTCELLLSGTQIDSTAIGNAIEDFTLVMDAIVTSGYAATTVPSPGHTIETGCPGGCMVPTG
jgi:hypothetical protein